MTTPDLPIIQKTYDLIVWYVPRLNVEMKLLDLRRYEPVSGPLCGVLEPCSSLVRRVSALVPWRAREGASMARAVQREVQREVQGEVQGEVQHPYLECGSHAAAFAPLRQAF